MEDAELSAIEVRGEDRELALLLCAQLRVFRYPLPGRVLISEVGDVVLCVMTWSASPGPEVLEAAAPALGEVAAAHLHREVRGATANVTPGVRRALLHLSLGAATEDPGERARALRNWARQARRTSRVRLENARRQGAEARRLLRASRRARLDATRARRRRRAPRRFAAAPPAASPARRPRVDRSA